DFSSSRPACIEVRAGRAWFNGRMPVDSSKSTSSISAGSSGRHGVAVVTGASSGIGLATAIELGRVGWSVAMASRRAEALQAGAEAVMRAGAAGVLVLPTDVGDPVQVESMIDGAVERFGRLDALINNAGVAPLAPIDRTDVEMLSRTFFVNAIG